MPQPPDSYNGAKRGRCRHGGSRRAGTASNGAIVIPALAGTIGLAAALVTGGIAGSCAAASGPHVTRRSTTEDCS